jgi:hypothetical protein
MQEMENFEGRFGCGRLFDLAGNQRLAMEGSAMSGRPIPMREPGRICGRNPSPASVSDTLRVTGVDLTSFGLEDGDEVGREYLTDARFLLYNRALRPRNPPQLPYRKLDLCSL